ncbi:MAG: nitronate monooxygenase [Pseudomonadota bacterium]|nr:nitronate monooxygenase [Pseudomonadota bacterium]
MNRANPLTLLLGVDHPVLLAPMAGVSGGALARAVSRAGGLGLIGGGYGDAGWLEEQLVMCAGERFGVGFITWALHRQPRLLSRALDSGAQAIMLSFGDIAPFAGPIRDADAVLIAQVQTVAQARGAVAAGAQIIVAQGGEAGGHGGLRGTIALVPAVVDAVSPVPVIAAGGIADGRGLAAALMLGAAGVLCGTAFYAAIESIADPRAKQRVLEASGDDTVKSEVFDLVRALDWPDGPWGLRSLRNGFSERWANDVSGLRSVLDEEQQRYGLSREQGDFDTAAVIAGEAVDLVHAIAPAADILLSLVDRCREAFASAP